MTSIYLQRCLQSALAGRTQGLQSLATALSRPLCTAVDRETLPFDVCIVGAGPAGLSAAIRLKQLAKEENREVSVAVLEKGSEIGSHILSGNVLDPKALNELFPRADPDDDDYAWQTLGAPVTTKARWDKFSILSKLSRWWCPVPSTMRNRGNYIVSLSKLCRWLGQQAEDAGVEILTGCAASDVVTDSHGTILGVVTKDMGVAKDGSKKGSYMPGAQVTARVTMFAEGARGSLSEKLISKLNLREEVGAEHQTYALGLKEVWEVDSSKHKEGLVEHLIGYPLDSWTYGGAFIYHMEDKKVSLGLVVALDYWNTYLNPYQEFQRFKSHPYIRRLLEDGECLEYGARVLNEGGIQSLPKVSFPGGCLLGCSAGLMNVARIKGTHTAMKSGMLAAEAAFREITLGADDAQTPLHMNGYARLLEDSWVAHELTQVKNIRPGFKWGLWIGMINAGLETYVYSWLFGGPLWTVPANVPDREATKPAASCQRIDYPPPDGEVTFDVATSLYRSGTNHEHDQPAHLKLKSPGAIQTVNVDIYDRPETRYCPAGVYEYSVDDVTGRPQLVINAQNCLHCKACDIKDPTQNIVWTVPEGGGGPNYTTM